METDVFKELSGNIVILGHHNADPDAVGAAIGVKELITSLSPKSRVVVLMPCDISRLSRGIINALEVEILEEYHDSHDSVIIVDTGSLNQLGEWEEKVRKSNQLIIIDHHSTDPETIKNAEYVFIDEKASSTSEIVYRIMKTIAHKPSTITAKALLAGIMFDSKFFSIGSNIMFSTVSELLEISGDITQIRELFTRLYRLHLFKKGLKPLSKR